MNNFEHMNFMMGFSLNHNLRFVKHLILISWSSWFFFYLQTISYKPHILYKIFYYHLRNFIELFCFHGREQYRLMHKHHAFDESGFQNWMDLSDFHVRESSGRDRNRVDLAGYNDYDAIWIIFITISLQCCQYFAAVTHTRNPDSFTRSDLTGTQCPHVRIYTESGPNLIFLESRCLTFIEF